MKKILIQNKLYDVTDMNDYTDNQKMFNPKITAIEMADGTVLPVKGRNGIGPGVYYKDGCMVANVEKPTESLEQYSSDNVIDSSKAQSMEELIRKENLVRDLENEILTTKDDITTFHIGPDDSPEMVGLRTALNQKGMNIYSYEDRFEQFHNDLRLLTKGETISLGKLISTCNSTDIEAELILRDANNGNVANPIGSEIRIALTARKNGGDIK